jgi:hypothetical protein
VSLAPSSNSHGRTSYATSPISTGCTPQVVEGVLLVPPPVVAVPDLLGGPQPLCIKLARLSCGIRTEQYRDSTTGEVAGRSLDVGDYSGIELLVPALALALVLARQISTHRRCTRFDMATMWMDIVLLNH